MPIRPVVSSELQPFELKQQPFTGLRDMLAAQESQARVEQTRLENDKLVRSAQEDAAFSRILQETGDDWETALKRISVEAPSKGSVYMRALQEARVSGLQAEQERVKLEKAEADDGLSLLNVAIARPQLWPFIAPGFAQRVPELAPVLEQLDPAAPDFVDTLKSLRQNGLLAKDAIEREDKWNQAFLEGDFRYAGEVIKQAKAEGGEALEEAKQALFGAGMTQAQIAAVVANPDAWTMTAAERAQEADRAAGRQIQVRGQDLSAQTQMRGQDLGAATARRGQDMTDARQRAQQAQTAGRPRELTPNAESAIVNRLSTQWANAQKGPRELQRQIDMMNAGLQAARQGNLAQGNEAVLQTFLKVLDPNSVVREGEFWRLQQGSSLIARAQAAIQRLSQGGWLPLSELEKYASLAHEMQRAQQSYNGGIRSRLSRTAQHYNIPEELVFDDQPTSDMSGTGGKASATPPSTGASGGYYQRYLERRRQK